MRFARRRKSWSKMSRSAIIARIVAVLVIQCFFGASIWQVVRMGLVQRAVVPLLGLVALSCFWTASIVPGVIELWRRRKKAGGEQQPKVQNDETS